MMIIQYGIRFFCLVGLCAVWVVRSGVVSASKKEQGSKGEGITRGKPDINQDISIDFPFLVKDLPFQPGEVLEYQGSHSLMPGALGIATMKVDEQLQEINGHYCHRIEVKLTTTSMGGVLFGGKIDNMLESYVDMPLLRTHKFAAHIQENNYKREEQMDFDYCINQAKIEIAESTNSMIPVVTYCPISNESTIRDLIGNYYFLRSIDTFRLKIGEKLKVNVLYENRVLDIAIVFRGRKTIITKFGKVSTLVFAPIVPIEEGSFLSEEENPIEIYISDDANKIPIKVTVNLKIGIGELQLVDYKGLKTPLALVDLPTPAA